VERAACGREQPIGAADELSITAYACDRNARPTTRTLTTTTTNPTIATPRPVTNDK
jgi:hypothetical protein